MGAINSLLSLSIFCFSLISAENTPAKPLFKDFMGINGHTVTFKPVQFRPVCEHVRDYHPMEWDTGNESNYATQFPMARNRVDWSQVYGSWKKSGFIIDVSIMFETLKQDKWKDI